VLRQANLLKHSSVLLIVCFLVSACVTRQQQNSKTEPAPQTLTVISSHGVQEIAPTVVASVAPPSSQDDVSPGSQQPDFTDPLEFINRPIFAFNDVLYSNVLIPLSHGYKKVMPQPLHTGVTNFFANIREPINGVNNLLQGKGAALGSNISRFVINSPWVFGSVRPCQSLVWY